MLDEIALDEGAIFWCHFPILLLLASFYERQKWLMERVCRDCP